MVERDWVLAPPSAAVRVTVSVEEAYNVLSTLSLLAMPEERSGFSEWVVKTAAALPAEVAQRHRLIFWALYAVIDLRQRFTSFAAYVASIAAADPEALRKLLVAHFHTPEYAWLKAPDSDTLLSDKAAYLAVIERLHQKKAVEKDWNFDPSLLALHGQAFDIAQDAPAMQQMIVEHLRWMWDNVMAAEWARVLPMLSESAAAFQRLDTSGMNVLEAIRAVTGRDLSGHFEAQPEHIVFVPSAHIGPYVSWDLLDGGKTALMAFGARLPEGVQAVSPALSRSELLVRLSALADDTRLCILELLTHHDELCAQDIIEKLDLSQSAASRHLRQLTATGYLIERRREVAKCYSLNPRRVEDTLMALKRFLRSR